MRTSSNGNIFRVTGHLCGEFTSHRWIPRTRRVRRSFDIFFDLRLNKQLRKQSWGLWFEMPSHPLWRPSNVHISFTSFITHEQIQFRLLGRLLVYCAAAIDIRNTRDSNYWSIHCSDKIKRLESYIVDAVYDEILPLGSPSYRKPVMTKSLSWDFRSGYTITVSSKCSPVSFDTAHTRYGTTTIEH